MANDQTPATKADIQTILNAIASLEKAMQQQFDFVAEKLTELLEKTDVLQDARVRLDETVDDHERRIRRLERRRVVLA